MHPAPMSLILPDHLCLTQCRHGPMLVPKGDRFVGRSLQEYGEYSQGEVDLFRQMVAPGAVVVEAGANLGALTIPFARHVGDLGVVIAFEPQRNINALLATNCVINSQEQVWCERIALGASEGWVRMPDPPLSGQGNFGGLALQPDGGVLVAQRTLDSYGLSRLDFMKVDVEGAERDVLLGARQTILRHRPILYVENDREDLSAPLIGLIMDMGYRLWWHGVMLFNPDNFRANPRNIFGGYAAKNMLCLPMGSPHQVVDSREILSPDDPHPF